MMKIQGILIVITFFLACDNNNQAKVINVDDYGINPNSVQSITSKINSLIESLDDQPVVINFPKGSYHFYSDSNYMKSYFETNTYDVNPKKLAIILNKKKNLTIDGKGSDFIYHGHIQPFTLDNSENIKIRNVNIDWEQPLTAEAEIIEADTSHLLVKIDTFQFPYQVHENGLIFSSDEWEAQWRLTGGSWLIEYTKDHIIPPGTGDFGCVNGDLKDVIYSEPSPGYILMKGNFTKTPSVGNYLIMRHSTRDHAGMFIYHSKNIELKNINIHHTSGLGILSQYTENITMNNVDFIPNPSKNRYLSGHDDGLHFMGCKGDILIEDCEAKGLMDDAINIHGTYVPIAEVLNNNTVKCNYAHSMSMGLIWAQAGDTIAFVEKESMQTVAYGVVEDFIKNEDKGFILKFKDKIAGNISEDFSIENLSWTANVHIRNCYAGSNRARGYLISTPGEVLIENNIFETSGSALLIAGDANYWYESGPVKNLTIRNNEFRKTCNSSPYQFCNAIISIYPEIPKADPEYPFHKNIIIEHNSFDCSDFPILYAKSVDGLYFRNNNITRSNHFDAWHPIKYNFWIEACRNVEIKENYFEENVLGKNIYLRNIELQEFKLKNKELQLVEDDGLK